MAVGLVVIYHLYPQVVPGGYVGVDVFFVISGFLITGHLARTLDRTGRVRLLDFYGRRARRLLPAAALVLTVTWLLSRELLPVTQLPAAAEQVRGSALYYQNWILARDAVDYLAQDAAPSPVQHFWSLSVEEQFYLVWPLLFVLAAFVGMCASRRASANDVSSRGHRPRQGTLLLLATAVVIASFVFSVIQTERNPASAYFVTTTRMWELGVGGLLALLPARITSRVARLGPAAWLGLGSIIASALIMSGASAFPGWIALFPVLGAALVLACGSQGARLGPASVTASRPFVFVGDISYSLYLWHWPLIVLWLAYRGGSIGVLDGPMIAVASIVLSWLTKVLVEDRVRQARIVVRHVGVSIATALTVIVPVVLVTVFLGDQPGPFRGGLDAQHPGAAVLAGAAHVSPAAPIPPVIDIPRDLPLTSHNGCEVDTYETQVKSCSFGDLTKPSLTVALVGDSHAGQWSSVLDRIGKRRHWKIVAEIHVACRWTPTMMILYGKPYTACHDWGAGVMKDLLTQVRPDAVVLSERPSSGTVDHRASDAQSWAEIGLGMADYARQLIAHGIGVVAIHETPEPRIDVPDCLAGRNGSTTACSAPRSRAVLQHTPIDAAKAQLGDQLPVIDLTDDICGPDNCRPVVGNVVVYRDKHHLTESYTLSLLPFLDRDLMATGRFGQS